MLSLHPKTSIYLSTFLLLSSISCLADPSIWDTLREGGASMQVKRGNLSATALDKNNEKDPITGKPIEKNKKKHKPMFVERVGHGLNKLGRKLNSDVKMQGSKSFGFHMETVSGSGDAYQNDNYYGRKSVGGAYDNTDLTVQAKLFGIINFETRYSNNLYGNPNDNKLSLNYANKLFKFDAGDITGSISGNTLVSFSRTLKGMQLTANILKGFKVTSLYTQTKAQTRTITINGGNSPGPYYVYAGQIVDGSEHVRVNNKDMVKGDDFTLDPYTGELNFKSGMIIATTDTIAVTFETYGYNQTTGTITGWRADLDMIKNTHMGFTYLTQSSGKQNAGISTKTDQFYGYNNIDTPYQLQYPVEMITLTDTSGKTYSQPKFPMISYVGGELKTYGIDYLVDAKLPNRIYFHYPIPSTQIVKITYTPQITDETPGSRNVWGLDSSLTVGKYGTISAEMASSRLDYTGQAVSDRAWQIHSDMNFMKNRLHWTWSLRDIGSHYTSIESPGFNRNDQGLTTGLDYQISKTMKISASMEKSKRPAYSYTSNALATDVGKDDYSQTNLSFNWQVGKAGQLSLAHNNMKTLLSNGGQTNYTTDNMSLSYALKKVSMDISLGRNNSYSNTFFNNSAGGTSSSQNNTYSSDALTSRLNLQWRAATFLTLGGVFALNSINNTGGHKTNAKDMDFTADVKPVRNLTLKLSWQNQNSGSAATTANPTTTAAALIARTQSQLANTIPISARDITGNYSGGGYNTNLGSSGNYSGGYYNSNYSNYSSANFAGKSNQLMTVINYQPIKNVSLDMSWTNGSSEGDYQLNSKHTNWSMNMAWNPNARWNISSTFSTQKVAYIGSTGGTNSTMLYLNMRAKPFGRLTTNLSCQLMKSNSALSTLTNTGNGTGTGTGLDYNGGNPFYNGSTSGGYGNFNGLSSMNLTSWSLRLEYPVWASNNLYFQYDDSNSSGYLASVQRTLMLGIDFPITNVMSFNLGYRLQEHIARDLTGASSASNSSYRVGSIDADINMHF